MCIDTKKIQECIAQLQQKVPGYRQKSFLESLQNKHLHLWQDNQRDVNVNDYVVPLILNKKINALVLHGVPDCMETLAQKTALTSLTVKLTKGSSSKSVSALASYLKETTSLKSFIFNNPWWFGKENMIMLFNALKENRSITELKFRNKHGYDLLGFMHPLVDYLQSKPRLTSLDIQHTWSCWSRSNDDHNFDNFVKSLSNIDTLTSLNLSHSDLSTDNVHAIITWLKQNPPLIYLNLSGNHMHKSCINAIIEMQQINNTLIELHFEAFKIHWSILERNIQPMCTLLLSALGNVNPTFQNIEGVSSIILDYAGLLKSKDAVEREPKPKSIFFSYNTYALCAATAIFSCGIYLARRYRHGR